MNWTNCSIKDLYFRKLLKLCSSKFRWREAETLRTVRHLFFFNHCVEEMCPLWYKKILDMSHGLGFFVSVLSAGRLSPEGQNKWRVLQCRHNCSTLMYPAFWGFQVTKFGGSATWEPKLPDYSDSLLRGWCFQSHLHNKRDAGSYTCHSLIASGSQLEKRRARGFTW